MQQLTKFLSFASIDEAIEISKQLQAKDIPTEIVKIPTDQYSFVSITGKTGNSADDGFVLNIPKKDFSTAYSLLYTNNPIDVTSVKEGHPLYGMSNEELEDIIAKPDEWGWEYYTTAVAMLKSKGVSTPDRPFEEVLEEKKAIVVKSKHPGRRLLTIAYILPFIPYVIMIFTKTKEATDENMSRIVFTGVTTFLVLIISKSILPAGAKTEEYDALFARRGTLVFALNILSLLISLYMYIRVLSQ